MSSRTMALYTAVGMKGSSGEFVGPESCRSVNGPDNLWYCILFFLFPRKVLTFPQLARPALVLCSETPQQAEAAQCEILHKSMQDASSAQ